MKNGFVHINNIKLNKYIQLRQFQDCSSLSQDRTIFDTLRSGVGGCGMDPTPSNFPEKWNIYAHMLPLKFVEKKSILGSEKGHQIILPFFKFHPKILILRRKRYFTWSFWEENKERERI